MAGRKGSRPRGWTKCPKLRAAYEEGGENIGKMMVLGPVRAEKLWKMISGTGIWPAWYNEGFRYHWIKDNPMSYHVWKKRNWRRRKRKQAKDERIDRMREQAKQDFLDG